MHKIPKQIKNTVYGISALVFVALSIGLGPLLVIGMIDLLVNITGYHFGISTGLVDYLFFASIPIFGLYYNSTRNVFKRKLLVQDIFTVFCCVLFMFGMGLFLMIYLNKNTNPLIPKYLLLESFNWYSTLFIALGLLFPFLLLQFIKKTTDTETTSKK